MKAGMDKKFNKIVKRIENNIFVKCVGLAPMVFYFEQLVIFMGVQRCDK